MQRICRSLYIVQAIMPANKDSTQTVCIPLRYPTQRFNPPHNTEIDTKSPGRQDSYAKILDSAWPRGLLGDYA